jgi:trans-aconitate 2-methyltransferase
MSWSPAQYTKFEDERTRPVRDLLANIPTVTVRTAADLGCGPGNSTELLQARFPDAVVTGMDSSADMIAAASKRLPAIRFELDDISAWRNRGPFDVILSNAVLQWVPDHKSLLPALMDRLSPGGALAVQVPDNADEPAHRLMREIAAESRWASKLGASSARFERHSAVWYFGELRGIAARLDVWRTTYFHPLAGADAVVEWFKGSGLRPILNALSEADGAEFLARYRAAIAEAYPALPDGTVLLPFPRLFFVAMR